MDKKDWTKKQTKDSRQEFLIIKAHAHCFMGFATL